MFKICSKCGSEFKISKFNPYFTQCKKCRKGHCKQTMKISINSKKKKNKIKCQRCIDHLTTSKQTGMWKCPLCRQIYTIIIKGIYKKWSFAGGSSPMLTNKVYAMGKFLGYHNQYGDLRRMINEYQTFVEKQT